MSGGACEVEALDRSLVAGPAGHRAHEEQLIERHLALVPVSLGKAELPLVVLGRPEVVVEDRALYVGGVFREPIQNPSGQRILRARPAPLPQTVRSELGGDAYDVLRSEEHT